MFKFMFVNISRLISGLKLYTFTRIDISLGPFCFTAMEKLKFLQKVTMFAFKRKLKHTFKGTSTRVKNYPVDFLFILTVML